MNKGLSFKENLFWNSLGSFTYLFCQWLLTFLVVRLSSDISDAGNLSLAISVTNIFFNVACFNVRPYLVSDFGNKYTINDYSTFRLITSLVAFIMCAIYISLFDYSQAQYICIMVYMIFKLGEACVDLFHAVEQRNSRMDIGGKSLFIRGIICVISFSISMLVFEDENLSIILMTLCTWCFIACYDYPKAKPFADFRFVFNVKKQKQLLIEFLPLAIGSFIGTTCTSLPRQFLEMIEGTASLGIYATVATPATIVQVASSYIYNPLLTTFGQLRAEGNKQAFFSLVVKITGIIIGVGIILTVAGTLLAEWGLNLLYGTDIAKYSNLFCLILVYTALNGYVWFLNNIMIIFRRMKQILIINATGLILCVLFSGFLINVYSMNGVTISMIIFTSVMLIEMLVDIFNNINKL